MIVDPNSEEGVRLRMGIYNHRDRSIYRSAGVYIRAHVIILVTDAHCVVRGRRPSNNLSVAPHTWLWVRFHRWVGSQS